MRILVVEDDRSMLDVIRTILEDESYEVDTATTGDEGLLLAEQGIYDALILDVMLPQLDGFTIIRRLRTRSITTPTLILTAKDRVEDRVKGLDFGADDYLVKPFSVSELLARVRALLRRAGALSFEGDLRCGPITVQPHQHDGFIGDEPLRLTSKEYELLEYFMHNQAQILTRDQLFSRVWGLDSEANSTVVDVYVHYLRKKLATHGCDTYIRTIRGVGYMIKEDTPHV